jgi:two-component system, NarL family, response regulator NreC
MAIKVLIADDHKIIRESLRTLIEQQKGMEVIAEAENGRSAVQLARKLAPDVVIMDIGMPGLNGIEATRQIVKAAPAVKVVALSMHADKRFALEMLKAGASGYVLKNSAFEEMVHAINCVMGQKIYLCPPVAGALKAGTSCFTRAAATVFSVLTAREREVLQLLAEGKATKEIASLLFVSVKTIETHRMQIMKKLDIHSVAELTKYAVRQGLTTIDL